MVALGDPPKIDIGTSDEPEALVRGTLLFQIFRQQVGVHLGSQESQARFLFGHSVNVFGGFGIELKGSEDENRGFRTERSGFFPSKLHLPLFEQAVFGTKGDDYALGL